MKKITADLIFNGNDFISSAIIHIDESGKIIELTSANDSTSTDDVIKYDGILCPGFINTHCHLELSYLEGKIDQHTGLDGFIRSLESQRTSDEEVITKAMTEAEKKMIANGIVAVGDISNGPQSLSIKKEKNIFYHTFIEVYGFHPDRAEATFQRGLELESMFTEEGLKASVSPHAPYSASVKLLKLISKEAYNKGEPLTIHMEESEDEDALFLSKSGRIPERLKRFGVDTNHFSATGFTALKSTLVHLPVCNKLQLVHNTFTKEEDIKWAEDYHKLIYWCFCPKANLFIENKIPDFRMFFDSGVMCTIGTDSLASNDSLDILDEMKVIHENAPVITLKELFKTATINGAEFLGIKDRFGSIEIGKKPGIILINGIDVEENKIRKDARVKRIV